MLGRTMKNAVVAAAGVFAMLGLYEVDRPAAPSLSSQAIREIALSNPVELPSTFTAVSNVIELRDGRVMALDAKERRIVVADFARGSAADAGRRGRGPREYELPGRLFRATGDSVVLHDWQQGRLLVFSPAGVPTRSGPIAGNRSGQPVTDFDPMLGDDAGFFYGATSGLVVPKSGKPGSEPPSYSDSVDIQRLNPKSGERRTVARIKSETSEGKRRRLPDGSLEVSGIDFGPRDSWTVLRDGRVALLRGGDYRVRFLANGKETLGPAVPHALVPFTADDRRAMTDSIAGSQAGDAKKVTIRPPRAAGPEPTVVQLPVIVKAPAAWPSHKPPYSRMFAAPDGRLFVRTPVPFGSTAQRFDMLDGRGALEARIVVPAGEKVVGFGKGTIYTVRTDADDLQYLRRYALPSASPGRP